LQEDKLKKVLREWIAPFEPEYRGNATFLDGIKSHAGPGFGYIEAQAIHGFIRRVKPRRVIEVGSGVSTWCILNALRKNETEGSKCELTCVDPYPSKFLESLPVKLERAKVEDVELTFFDQLGSNDILSIDTSHAVRCCGDVARLYVEVLPRLNRGVLIHIHDISFPYVFPRDVEQTYTQAMESAVLFTLLSHSVRYEVLICLSLMHYTQRSLMMEVFPEYDPQPDIGGLPGIGVEQFGERRHFPGSTYLVVK
jgi:predicted O-methyltransferase YrrM